ncbi:fungal pheromone STE3G-protein-coupled receptor [Rickenella mellea]|uniref:Fungal pheromone STE3G-protein-coupled receptor n=1 Tax=Rickenella mellea TaxID=50990 RepID=A0A4Y7PNT3_9AGAM|nr:fungal pheromone STE3G-protein-coupled receptor [Rickenella mellea]
MDLQPSYPIFSIMIFLSFVASLLPWAWIRRDNTGILFISLWLAIACLNQFVNSVIWYGNTRNFLPVWCDISSRLIVGIAVAIPGSIMCMVRRLYQVCSMKSFLLTPKEATLIEDLSICLGIPILQMVLDVIRILLNTPEIIKVHRYDIIEDIGCYPAPINAWLAYMLSYSWPVILGFVTAVYSVLTIRAIGRNGKEIDKFFEHKAQRKHYIRLVILALCEITFATPFAVVVLILDLTAFPVHRYISLENTHSHYSRVNQVPAAFWRSDPLLHAVMEMCRWILVLCAITFYGVFGFSAEAINVYKKGFWTVVGLVGIRKRTMRRENIPQ